MKRRVAVYHSFLYAYLYRDSHTYGGARDRGRIACTHRRWLHGWRIITRCSGAPGVRRRRSAGRCARWRVASNARAPRAASAARSRRCRPAAGGWQWWEGDETLAVWRWRAHRKEALGNRHQIVGAGARLPDEDGAARLHTGRDGDADRRRRHVLHERLRQPHDERVTAVRNAAARRLAPAATAVRRARRRLREHGLGSHGSATVDRCHRVADGRGMGASVGDRTRGAPARARAELHHATVPTSDRPRRSTCSR